MRETLKKLQTLQDINSEIENIRHDRDRLSIDVDNQALTVERKTRQAQEAHEKRLENAKTADRVQMNIEEAEQEIERLSVQLNSVRNQRELDTIQNTIRSRQADIARWEDEALSALQAVDELRQEEGRLHKEVEAAQAELERVKEETRERREEYEQRIEELTEQREQLRDEMPPEVLSAYERIAARHPNNALAEVKGRVCGGCFTQITKQTENLLMRDDKVVYCHSCGRMLMLKEPPSGSGA